MHKKNYRLLKQPILVSLNRTDTMVHRFQIKSKLILNSPILILGFMKPNAFSFKPTISNSWNIFKNKYKSYIHVVVKMLILN